jgi:hypothetical protein
MHGTHPAPAVAIYRDLVTELALTWPAVVD